MATNEAETTVKKVEQIDHAAGDQGGGAHNAYDELSKEYQDYAKNHTAADTKTYWDSVTSKLASDNVLPDLAVAWGQENFNNFDFGGNKQLNAADLTTPFTFADPNNAQANFDKTFANSLKGAMDDMHKKYGGWFSGFTSNDITQSELSSYLKDQGEHNKVAADQQTARNGMEPLLNTYVGPDGKPQPLMALLDQEKNGKTDGYVSSTDMHDFLSDYNKFTENGHLTAPAGSPYTKDNADYVQSILDGKHGNINKNGFSVSDLAKAGGFDNVNINNQGDYSKVLSEYNALQKANGAQQTTDTTAGGGGGTSNSGDTTTNGITKNSDGEITKIQYPDGVSRQFGYDSSSDKQPTSTTYPDGTQYHKDSSGKWVGTDNKPAPFNTLTVDGSGNVSFGFPKGQSLNINPQDTTTVSQKEKDGATVTTDNMGNVVEEDGKSGVKNTFGYDSSGKLNGVNLNGTEYKLNGSEWDTANGQKAGLQNFNIDSTSGNLTYTDGDKHYSVNDNGDVTQTDSTGKPKAGTDPATVVTENSFANLPKDVQQQLKNDVVDKIVNGSAAQPGDGYIAISARLLGVPTSDPKAEQLFQQIAAADHAQPPYMIYPNQKILSPETLKTVAQQNPDLQKIMMSLLMKETQTYLQQHPGTDGSVTV